MTVRSGALVGAVGAVSAVGLVLLAPWSSPTEGAGPTIRAAQPISPSTGPSSTSTEVETAVRTRPPVRANCPAPMSVLVADIDGDGCLDGLNYVDGVLETGGVRWAVGRAGDQVATGDWTCAGKRTLVLLRPSTGEVFRFDAWAVGAHESVTGTAVATVAGGQAVRAADLDHDGCHEVVVERGELPPQVVRLPRPQP